MLKGLKNPEKLHLSRQQPRRLRETLKLNEPLAATRRALNDWITPATYSGIRMLQRFAGTLQRHAYALLAWYEHPIWTGPLEGVNNKIKTVHRRAYGYGDNQYFIWRIYGLHETKYALLG